MDEIAIRLTQPEARRILDWVDGLDDYWKAENWGKADEDLRYAIWLAATGEPGKEE